MTGPTQHPEGAAAPTPSPDPLGRRSLISSGAAAGLGIVVLALPSARAAASGDGLLAPAGSFATPTVFSGEALDGAVSLSWTAVDGADGYQVQYREGDSGPFAFFVDVPGGASAGATISGLVNGRTYEFRVVAYQGAAVSQPTAVVSLTPALSAPGVPEGLGASPAESGQLAVTWFRSSTGGEPALYRVERRINSPQGSWIDSGTTVEPPLLITGLVNGTAYDVRVRAENSTGVSDWSATVTATPLAATVETLEVPGPQPPVVGVITNLTSVVVVTDRLEPANSGFSYSWKVRNAADGTYSQPVVFADGDATFTITGVPTSGAYTVRKTNGTTTNLSSFTYGQSQAIYPPGALYRIDNPSTGSSYVGSVQVDVRGGAGGFGGRDGAVFDTDRNGGAPSQPGRVVAIVPFALGQQLGLASGRGGGTGANDASGSGGGAAGTSILSAYNGGRGGNAGPSGDSGAGGGGGAASVVLRGAPGSLVPVVIAGGAAGGGGGNVGTSRDGVAGSSTPGGHTGTTGQQGAQRSNGDAAGAGGGGGGAVAGLGGTLELNNSKYRTADPGARPGTNLVAAGVTASVDGLTTGVGQNTAGQVVLTYLVPGEIVVGA